MDIGDTIAPSSDQLDAVDLLTGAQTFTIKGVSRGTPEQPVQIAFAEFPRPWRPGKSMRRVLVACWGSDASAYVGRHVRLYCDPDVRFGGQAVGGVRVAALSHIDKPRQVPLLVSRGKSAIFVVKPLTDQPPQPHPITDDQLQLLQQHYKDVPRDVRLAEAGDVLGRGVDAFSTLTHDEAAKIIDHISGDGGHQ